MSLHGFPPGNTFLRLAILALLAAPALAQTAIDLPPRSAMPPEFRCLTGAYGLSDGRSLVITGAERGPRELDYQLSSGEYGRLTTISSVAYLLGASPGYGSVSFTGCGLGDVMFRETGRPDISGRKVDLRAINTFFDSAGERLHGKLVLPADGKAKAIMVWIQGSDDDPATDDEERQYILPLKGIGVFVYDKRGSGASGGELTADFNVRANHTAAAVAEARRLAPDVAKVGVSGGSQGGWIAPLTATKTKLDFVIVGYSLAEGVTAQDRDEVEEQVRAAGYGDDVVAKVHQVTSATARIVKSGWKTGWREFATLQMKFASEPWIGAIETVNGYTGIMLKTPIDQIRQTGPKLDKHISFNYDPRPVIARIRPRQLWILGGADRTTPSAKTIAILRQIQKTKPNLDLVVYQNADHGTVETFQFEGVMRHRHPANLDDLIAQWILHGTLPLPDNDLQIHRPPHG